MVLIRKKNGMKRFSARFYYDMLNIMESKIMKINCHHQMLMVRARSNALSSEIPR